MKKIPFLCASLLFISSSLFVNIGCTDASNVTDTPSCDSAMVQVETSNTERYQKGQCVDEKALLADLKKGEVVDLTNKKSCYISEGIAGAGAVCTLYRSDAEADEPICFKAAGFAPVLQRENTTQAVVLHIQSGYNAQSLKSYPWPAQQAQFAWPLDDFPFQGDAAYAIQINQHEPMNIQFIEASSPQCEQESFLEGHAPLSLPY